MADSAARNSAMYVSFPVTQELLSGVSPVFNQYFCVPSRKNQQHIYLEDSSFKSYATFFAHALKEKKEEEGSANQESIDQELFYLANKYQNKEVLAELKEQLEDVIISEENVVDIAISAMKLKDNELGQEILKRCIEAVNDQEMNVWKNYREEETFERAALYLTKESKKLEKKLKVPNHGVEIRKACKSVSPNTENNSGDPEKDEIDITELGESLIYITYPISKQLLAKKSPVFRRQFCGPLRNKSRKNVDYLEAVDVSPEAYQAFFAYIQDDQELFSNMVKKSSVLIQTLLLADKYQVDNIFRVFKDCFNRLIINKENLVNSVKDIVLFKDLAPCKILCKLMFAKCARFVVRNNLDAMELFTQGWENGADLIYFNTELKEYRKNPGAYNCGRCVECQIFPDNWCRSYSFTHVYERR